MVAVGACRSYVGKGRYVAPINIFVDISIKLRLYARPSAVVVECRVDLKNKAISNRLIAAS